MVIALAPAVKLAAPGTVSAPVCVIAPEAITVRSCPPDEAASGRPVLSVICTLLAPVLVSVTAAWKSLPALVSVIAFAPALKLATPVAVTAALCVIAPLEIAASCPTEEAPKLSGVLSVIEARFAPEFDSDTSPPNESAALVMVMALAPAVILAVVAVVIAPGCVGAPLEIAGSDPTEVAPRSSGVLSVIEARLAEFDSDTAPPNELAALVMVIALAPALKLAVVAVVIAPDCVSAPLEIAASEPTELVPRSSSVLSVIEAFFA